MSVRHAKILSHIAACSMAVVAERIMQGSIIFGDLALIDFHICPLNLDRVPGVLWVGAWGMGNGGFVSKGPALVCYDNLLPGV